MEWLPVAEGGKAQGGNEKNKNAQDELKYDRVGVSETCEGAK